MDPSAKLVVLPPAAGMAIAKAHMTIRNFVGSPLNPDSTPMMAPGSALSSTETLEAQLPMDEFALLQEYARSRSQEAYRQLVERYAGLVYAAARRQVRDKHLAEDVTQAVFVVLAQKAGTIRPGRPLSAWLLTTTRYTCSNA